MGEEFGVDPQLLADSARALRQVPEELAGISGFPVSSVAASGMGLTKLSSLDVSHEGFSSALGEFGDAWDYGTRNLVHDGLSAADQLETVQQDYQRMDSAAADELRKILPGGA